MAVFRVRPTGYKYPVGLTFDTSSGSSNAATNVTGGTKTIDGTNSIHTYTTSGFFHNQFLFGLSVEYLVVGGAVWKCGRSEIS